MHRWLFDLALGVELFFDGWDLGWGLFGVLSWLNLERQLSSKIVDTDGICFLKILIIGNIDEVSSIIIVGDAELIVMTGDLLTSSF